MGLRGPKPSSQAELRARGSWIAKKRSKKDAAAPKLARRYVPPAPSPEEVEEICRTGIPGYDPWKDSDGFVFDANAAAEVIGWFQSHLTHVKGELSGKAFRLERWERAIVGNAFGWKDKRGCRRYRRVLIFVARKNGKTPLAAGFANRLYLGEHEGGAEVYSIASTRAQARLVWSWASGQIRRDRELRGACRIYSHSIVRTDDLESFYQPVAAEAQGLDGANAHAAIIDELHALSDPELVRVAETSTAARRQPMIVYITHAGYDRDTICHEVYQYGCDVRDGAIVDPKFLPAIFEPGEGDNWRDEKTWAKANPNLGVSVKLDYFRGEFERAVRNPAYEATFRRLHLNQWTEAETLWISSSTWSKFGEVVNRDSLQGRVCFGGLDISLTRDMTSLALCFPPTPQDAKYRLINFFWLPDSDLKDREDRDRASYFVWSQRGWLELIKGSVIESGPIERTILQAKKMFKIQEIAYDRYRSGELVTRLSGAHGMTMVEHGQGFLGMNAPMAEMERLLLLGELRHEANPIMQWQIGRTNAVRDTSGNMKPDKSSRNARIDGVVAAIMAVGRAVASAPKSGSVYSQRGGLCE